MYSTNQRLQPFRDFRWKAEKQQAVDLIWDWHHYLRSECAANGIERLSHLLEEDSRRLQLGQTPDILPEHLVNRVIETSSRHVLPLEWFGEQMKYAHRFYEPIRIVNPAELKSLVKGWVSPHAYLIAKMADAAHNWQRKQLDELSLGFFLVDALIHLREDLAERDHLFIPMSELEHAGVSVDQLKSGNLDESMRRLLWKQTIRARDAFAQGQPLLKDLERRYRGVFKRNWLTGLELINEIEKRKYDVWSAPVQLSRIQTFQIRVLTLIGKGARQTRK